jgi:hypothetical protein
MERGRPTTISEHARQVCLIARCCPRDLGLAFTTWSLSKLADYLAVAGIARISREAIRQIQHAGGIRWQATKTWKASTDPDFTGKMHRVPGHWLGRGQRGAGRPADACLLAELDRTGVRGPALFRPDGTDHRTHAWQGEMIAAYMR